MAKRSSLRVMFCHALNNRFSGSGTAGFRSGSELVGLGGARSQRSAS